MQLTSQQSKHLTIAGYDSLTIKISLTCETANPIAHRAAVDDYLTCQLRWAYYYAAVAEDKHPKAPDMPCVLDSQDLNVLSAMVTVGYNRAINGQRYERSGTETVLSDTFTGDSLDDFVKELWTQAFAMQGVDIEAMPVDDITQAIPLNEQQRLHAQYQAQWELNQISANLANAIELETSQHYSDHADK